MSPRGPVDAGEARAEPARASVLSPTRAGLLLWAPDHRWDSKGPQVWNAYSLCLPESLLVLGRGLRGPTRRALPAPRTLCLWIWWLVASEGPGTAGNILPLADSAPPSPPGPVPEWGGSPLPQAFRKPGQSSTVAQKTTLDLGPVSPRRPVPSPFRASFLGRPRPAF